MPSNSEASHTLQHPRSTARLFWLILLGLAVFVMFIALGTWQVHRRAWKLNLIWQVNHRVHAPPVAAPGPTTWANVTAQRDQYRHVRLKGHFLSNKTTLVHGSSDLGYGFWVMAPLLTERGFIVLVNRGYVPANSADSPVVSPPGTITLTGLLRITEPGGGFLRANRPQQGHWYSRDVAAIARSEGLSATRVAPYFVDAAAGQHTGQWPVGGLTRVHFYNEHLVYAITWYALAALTLLGAWIVGKHERQARRLQ